MATQSGAQPMTVTVTSYYVPTPTAANTDSGSTSSSGGGGGSKKFVADATGAAVGGFALTCVIGWLLFQVWKRRHPTKWHRRRSDAENFPGWRRVTASKLYEANYDGVDESKSEVRVYSTSLWRHRLFFLVSLRTHGRPFPLSTEHSSPNLDR